MCSPEHSTVSVPTRTTEKCAHGHRPRTQNPLAKAQDLIDAGKVQHVERAYTYDVGEYQVTLRPGVSRCTCRATVTCKHVHAAALVHLAETER